MIYKKVKKVVKKSVKRKVSKMPLKSIKLVVKREMARAIEDKVVNFINHTGHQINPSNGGMNTQTIALSPYPTWLPIQQGTGQGQRVGNAINIKRASIRGTIYPQVYDATYNPQPLPCRVIFWLIYDKENDNILPTVDSTFLQNGSSSMALQNSLTDCWTPINTDRWRVLSRKVFKLGNSSSEGSGALSNFQYFSNNDFKYNCDFNIDYTKHLVKHVKFNDNTATPSTRGLFLVSTIVASNGSALQSIQRGAMMEYSIDMSYEDA